MKNCVYFCLLIMFIFSFGIIRANNLELLGHVIYLDPGHGGADPGAVYGGLNESDINLEISFKIKEELEKYGAIVYMTRYGDYDLAVINTNNRKRSDLFQRVNLINESNALIYYSIHLNAIESSSWRGAQVFYSSVLEENEEIALEMQKYFKDNLKSSREYKEINDVYMYQRVDIPGVLIELGFLSNSSERSLLVSESYQEKIALLVKDFTLDYVGVK